MRAIMSIILMFVLSVASATAGIRHYCDYTATTTTLVTENKRDYYPYGGLSGESASHQSYKYSGKELETMNGLNTYDFHARPYYYPAIIFHSPDILSEKTPWLSPYLYCAGNPVMFIDPTGMESWWSQIWNDPEIMARIEGAIKAAGGITEAVVGATAGVATSWTGVGAVLGGAALVHGCDVAASGISQMISGEETSSLTSQGLQAAGVPKETAEMIDGGISIGLTGSAGMIGKGGAITTKATSSTKNNIENAKKQTSFFENTQYTDKVKQQMKQGDFHSFPKSVEAFEKSGNVTTITGGDKMQRSLLKIPGSYKGENGYFEFIKEQNGDINHRLFVPTK